MPGRESAAQPRRLAGRGEVGVVKPTRFSVVTWTKLIGAPGPRTSAATRRRRPGTCTWGICGRRRSRGRGRGPSAGGSWCAWRTSTGSGPAPNSRSSNSPTSRPSAWTGTASPCASPTGIRFTTTHCAVCRPSPASAPARTSSGSWRKWAGHRTAHPARTRGPAATCRRRRGPRRRRSSRRPGGGRRLDCAPTCANGGPRTRCTARSSMRSMTWCCGAPTGCGRTTWPSSSMTRTRASPRSSAAMTC